MATNSELLFNGKSMRNAIIKKLAEDHNLTSAMFSNSNITILVDIISYMYQSLMTNLRFAAAESMFTDTMLFENAARLSNLIGYYAKGAYPYSLIAKMQTADNATASMTESFLATTLTYGPYSYNFSIVDDLYATDANDARYVKLVLGDWDVTTFTATGTKFEEFEMPNIVTSNKYISQQFVNVYVNGTKWTYSETPLFSLINHGSTTQTRLISYDPGDNALWQRFNFYVDENNRYILKFGDGLTSAMPNPDDEIVVVYITSTYTAANISQNDITAIANAGAGKVKLTAKWSAIKTALSFLDDTIIDDLSVMPVTQLAGYKNVDTAESIKKNASGAFSRQQRVVTKSDYKSYLLEHDNTVADCLVQNNWDLIATYYGYIYNLASQVVESSDTINTSNDNIDLNNDIDAGLVFVEEAAKKGFGTTLDAADANNVYIWQLDKAKLGLNEEWNNGVAQTGRFGVNGNIITLSDTFAAIKNITEHVVTLQPIWRTYCPFVTKQNVNPTNYIKLNAQLNIGSSTNSDDLLDITHSVINVYADLRYISSIARIKSSVNSLIKEYLYDDIKLGVTPNISQLLKLLLNITGVNSVTTMKNDGKEILEVQGLQFLTWTAFDIVSKPVGFDTMLTYGLPQINQFEYLKCAVGYTDFISKFIHVLPDYNRSK